MPNKVMISLRVEPELARLLKLVKERDGVPESEQARRGLRLYFQQKGLLKPPNKRGQR